VGLATGAGAVLIASIQGPQLLPAILAHWRTWIPFLVCYALMLLLCCLARQHIGITLGGSVVGGGLISLSGA